MRKLRNAQLRILTISGHVIAVSAQQRDNEKGVRCARRRSGSDKWYIYCFFRSVVQSNEACIDLEIADTSEMTTPKMHRDKNYTNYFGEG